MARSRARILPDRGVGRAVLTMLSSRKIQWLADARVSDKSLVTTVHVAVMNYPDCIARGATQRSDVVFDKEKLEPELAHKVDALARKINGVFECCVRHSAEHGVLETLEMEIAVVGDQPFLECLPREIGQILVSEAA